MKRKCYELEQTRETKNRMVIIYRFFRGLHLSGPILARVQGSQILLHSIRKSTQNKSERGTDHRKVYFPFFFFSAPRLVNGPILTETWQALKDKTLLWQQKNCALQFNFSQKYVTFRASHVSVSN